MRIFSSDKKIIITRYYLRCHGPRVCHRDVFKIEKGDAAHDLRSGFEDCDCGLEELLGRIFSRVPIAKTVDH